MESRLLINIYTICTTLSVLLVILINSQMVCRYELWVVIIFFDKGLVYPLLKEVIRGRTKIPFLSFWRIWTALITAATQMLHSVRTFLGKAQCSAAPLISSLLDLALVSALIHSYHYRGGRVCLIVHAAAQLLTLGSSMLHHKVVINYVLGIYYNFSCAELDLDHCIIRHCDIEVLLRLDKKVPFTQ